MRRALATAITLLAPVALSVACGPPPEPVSSTAHARVSGGSSSLDEAFAGAYGRFLSRLGVIDRRLALRTGALPTEADEAAIAMSVITSGDTSAQVVLGALDPFSFEARERELASATKDLEAAPRPESREGIFQRTLALRLAGEEAARGREERDLPRSASTLVRAMIQSLDPPRSLDERTAQDRWVARRLADIEASVVGLMEPARRELDDALDPIDRVVSEGGYPLSAPLLAHLRGTLDESHAKGPRAPWADVSARLLAHTGFDEKDPATLDARFASVESTLESYLATALPPRGDSRRDAITKEAEKWVAREDVCRLSDAGPHLRPFGAPPERAPGCHLIRALSGAIAPDAELALLVALHDHLALARWALAVAAGPDRTLHPFLAEIPVDREERLARLANVRPVIAISAGLVAELLLARGPTKAHEVARAFFNFGDAPLDMLQELLKEPSQANAAVVSSTHETHHLEP